ncbi:VOC family protein [Arthrobacter agilis]|uniref:VOC family protein n=1 Tax=Arthrobacter agilis TaxID=37921 RepID=UPI00277F0ED8|nr:VOC family protein [Arthrobacter agilis]MDQ0733885.1 catechol 2,3-dioxygenase-like lactoylglutathione lyase family enzyme [Arthrobacter agilis]
MAGERMYPILTVPDLDEAITFYEDLGFHRTYRQVRPNPHAVVELEDIGIHLSAVPGFDPAASLGSVIITVPDADALYRAFADGLRRTRGRIPSAGIPRLLRPRRKQGTTSGFSVVDVGGNWLRISRTGDTEDDGADRATGLARVLEVAARQGDARGAEDTALDVLDRGLARHPEAPAADRARAELYRAELLTRLGRHASARAALAQAESLVGAAEAEGLAEDLASAREILAGGEPGAP